MVSSTVVRRTCIPGLLIFLLCMPASLQDASLANGMNEPGWAQVQVRRVDDYLYSLPFPDVDDEDAVLIHETMQSLGAVSTSLLLRGQRGGPGSASAFVAGSMLADGLPSIRESLEQLHSDSLPSFSREAARDELKRFDEEFRYRREGLVTPAPARLDATLQELFSPLRTAIRHLDQVPPPSGWWSSADVQRSGSNSKSALAKLIAAATWLTNRQQSGALEALEASTDRASNDVVLRIGMAIDAISRDPDSRYFLNKLPEIFMRSIGAREQGRPARGALLELARGLERRVQFNQRSVEDLPRDLRLLDVRLGELYTRAERKMIEQIDLLLSSRSPRSDPELVAIIISQRDALDAIELLAAMPRQIEFFNTIAPPEAASIKQQVTKMVRQLDDVQRRDDAMRALRSLAWQVHTFRNLPLERNLVEGDPSLDALLANRSTTILDRIRDARIVWAGDWGRGESLGSGVLELARLNRLMEHVAVASAFQTGDEPGSRLEPWSAWSMPDDRIRQWHGDLRDRLRVAAMAIAEEDVEQADGQLHQLELELSVLRLAHLLVEIGPAPPGGTGAGLVIGQLAMPPEKDAWLLEHRQDLALLSSMAMEMQAARLAGREEEAEELHRALASRAHALWTRLSGGPSNPVRIPGFDGTDPDPELSTYRLKHDRLR